VVSEHEPAEAVWMSRPALQTVLLRQLEEWKRTSQGIALAQVETVVKAALTSFSESYDTKETYTKVKALCISLLRSVSEGDDELAFELSIQYHYFEGLCQISVDHEKKRDANSYSLDPLFATMQNGSTNTSDLLSGFSFCQFVLHWHTEAGLYGHTINYGRHSHADLTYIMERDERLRQYRWIPAIRQNYFEQATESCLQHCDEIKTLQTNQWMLSMAKLANKLVASQNNKSREKTIERRLDLVHAQQMLMEDENENENVDNPIPLMQPEEMVGIAMKKLVSINADDDSMEERVRLCTIALTVCVVMEDESTGFVDHTAHVWAESLRLDAEQWQTWLQTETDLTSERLRDTVLSTTVFGTLLQECRKEDTLSPVTYGRHIESKVLEKIDGCLPTVELSRLLRIVTARSDYTIRGQSLVVASY
jgi:hypothetical protein